MSSIDSIVTRLLALHPKLIDLSLDRMWRLLAALGHPERQLPPVIHVAGTNGKGSTIAFMRAILEAAGLRVHVYTSPHLVRFNERFRLGAAGEGVLVADDELASAFEECERANAGEPITVFEITTAAGLLLFARHPADVLLLEVGLGGRLDATNVIERPLATVDHAGVVRSCRLSRRQRRQDRRREGRHPQARRAGDRGGAAARGARGDRARGGAGSVRRSGSPGENWTATEERGRLVYQDDDGLLDLPAPRLSGRHQFENAGVAIAALRAMPMLACVRPAFEAVAKAEWPARMQRLSQGKLPGLLPPGSELWLDGGHNADGGRAVANALADLEERVSRPLVLIVGMLATQGCRRVPEEFLRAGAAAVRGADPGSGEEHSRRRRSPTSRGRRTFRRR